MLDETEKRIYEKLRQMDLTKEAAFTPFLEFAQNVINRDYGNRRYVLELTGWIKRRCTQKLRDYQSMNNRTAVRYSEVYWNTLLFEARNRQLDSYMLYLERNRNPKDKFYQPKRKQFMKIGLVQAVQEMLDDELDILSISMPPGTGKTTFEKFLHSGAVGWFSERFSLFYTHSDDLERMYYDGILNILADSDEYTWSEIFPDIKITMRDAKRKQINCGSYKAFPNVQCTSVGSKNAGKVRCDLFLLCDDFVAGIEEALNKNMLDKLWGIYSVDSLQRKLPGCKEIHIATRWSVHDVIGRLQRIYENDPRARFIAVPDIDPVTGQSNFDYDYGGMDVEFFRKQEAVMDNVSYRCLYKNEPVEREGLLYHEDELRRYVSLPEREPDAVIGVCDVKNKGTDFMFLPCAYQYDDDFYIVDCVCDDTTDFDAQYRKLTNIIIRNGMQQCEFESNNGGDRVAYEVNKRVETAGGRCSITEKPTETNKETRIIVNADWVKKHCIFRRPENYDAKSDYGIMMKWLLSYSIAGKNPHDDVPDGLANFALFVTNTTKCAKIEAFARPW